jgi:hypothetical protein
VKDTFEGIEERNRGNEPIQDIIHIYTRVNAVMKLSIDILNKQKCLFFSNMEDRKVKQLFWRLVPVGGDRV